MNYKFPNTLDDRKVKALELDIDLLVENLKDVTLLYRRVKQEFLQAIEATKSKQITEKEKEAKKAIEDEFRIMKKIYFMEVQQLKKTFEKIMKGK